MRLFPIVVMLLGCLLHAAAAEGEGRDFAVAVFPSGAQFTLELATTFEDRARGYMYREHVGPHEGMLFIFEKPSRHGFHMKNCLVNLDIIWLDETFRVVHIASDLPPCKEGERCDLIMPMSKASYVLEVAGGTASANGLSLGDKILTLP